MKRTASIAIVLLITAPVHAQDEERARELFERGVAAMERGSPGEAATYFNESYQLVPRASTACNMATAQERLDQPCEAQSWYEQCAALDRSGRFREHAEQQAQELGARCQAASPPENPPDPFVRPEPEPQMEAPRAVPAAVPQPLPPRPAPVRPYIVRPAPFPLVRRSPSHTLLGFGLAAIGVGAGAIVGGGFAAGEAQRNASLIVDGDMDGWLPAGSEDAYYYDQAKTWSNVAIALYAGGAVLGALGIVLTIIDLAQPGVFGGAASAQTPRFTLRTTGNALTPDGVLATIDARF
jgi:hypothetical protein